MTEYMNRITPDFVKLSIGLRAPQLYEESAPLAMKVPQAFFSSLTAYFEEIADGYARLTGKVGVCLNCN